MATDIKSTNCPDFLWGNCPICGLLTDGIGSHPDVQGAGIEAMREHLDIPKDKAVIIGDV